MDKKQQENRRKAARKFMHSLDELETVLQSDPRKGEAIPQPTPPRSSQAAANPHNDENLGHLLDEAVQDIEQFMSSHPDDESDS